MLIDDLSRSSAAGRWEPYRMFTSRSGLSHSPPSYFLRPPSCLLSPVSSSPPSGLFSVLRPPSSLLSASSRLGAPPATLRCGNILDASRLTLCCQHLSQNTCPHDCIHVDPARRAEFRMSLRPDNADIRLTARSVHPPRAPPINPLSQSHPPHAPVARSPDPRTPSHPSPLRFRAGIHGSDQALMH